MQNAKINYGAKHPSPRQDFTPPTVMRAEVTWSVKRVVWVLYQKTDETCLRMHHRQASLNLTTPTSVILKNKLFNEQ